MVGAGGVVVGGRDGAGVGAGYEAEGCLDEEAEGVVCLGVSEGVLGKYWGWGMGIGRGVTYVEDLPGR